VTTIHPIDRRASPRGGSDGENENAEHQNSKSGPTDYDYRNDGAERPARRLRLGPILPARLRPLNRPTLWVEIALIAISYFCYRLTQNQALDSEGAATRRGFDILRYERFLHIDFEHWLNHTVAKVGWLTVGMNYYYATLHFIVPIVVLVWVYLKFPDRYRAIRTVMFATTGLALIGFYFYALAPPRMLPGFIDTGCVHHTWGQQTCTGVAGLTGAVSNAYAAMPSLHIGWSVWCALAIAHLAKRRWVKILGILYPIATFTVIISTANHYVLDAVGGLVTLGAGFLVQRILQGRPVYAAPEHPAGDSVVEDPLDDGTSTPRAPSIVLH
jgi:PAP2 superfamily